MILPILAYGHPLLRRIAPEIGPDYPGLDELIANMFDTLYQSEGVGLAAPQVNDPARLFIIDASPFEKDNPDLKGFKKVFINPHIIDETGEEWSFNEGCLSIPEIREDVLRKPHIRIQYQDQDFNSHEEFYDGIPARIIQHEYDHLEGKLFVDRISPLRKILLKRKLNDISTGNIEVAYKMIFPVKKKKVKVR
jgi:peptide deformylase